MIINYNYLRFHKYDGANFCYFALLGTGNIICPRFNYAHLSFQNGQICLIQLSLDRSISSTLIVFILIPNVGLHQSNMNSSEHEHSFLRVEIITYVTSYKIK